MDAPIVRSPWPEPLPEPSEQEELEADSFMQERFGNRPWDDANPFLRFNETSNMPGSVGSEATPGDSMASQTAHAPPMAGPEATRHAEITASPDPMPKLGPPAGGSNDATSAHSHCPVGSKEPDNVPKAASRVLPEQLTGLVSELEEEVRAVLGDVRRFIDVRPDLVERGATRWPRSPNAARSPNGAGSPKAVPAIPPLPNNLFTEGYGIYQETGEDMQKEDTLEEVPMVQESCSFLCRSSSAGDSSMPTASNHFQPKSGAGNSAVAAQIAARQRFKAEQRTKRRVAS